jgi:hypothetical protein
MTGIWSDAGLSRARHFALATVAAVILTLMAVADAGAAAPVTFGESEGGGLQLGSACLNGRAPADTPIRIVWKSASGRIKARVDTTSNLGGGWDYCSETKHLRVGDTIKAVVNGTKRTVTMPKVTIASDRVREFHGRGPANAQGDLWYTPGGRGIPHQRYWLVTTDSAGRWSRVVKSSLMGKGGLAEIDWSTPEGDYFTAYMNTPYVQLTLGKSQFAAGGRALTDGVVRLRDPADSSLRGRATVSLDHYGGGTGQFLDGNGNPVAVRAGDRMVSNLASNLDWLVPDVTGSADVAHDLVNGACSSTEISPTDALVRVIRTRRVRGYVWVGPFADSDGNFVADFGEPPSPFYNSPANIKHGDRVTIDCYYDTGDIVSMAFRVP